jgi:hypothetical protein
MTKLIKDLPNANMLVELSGGGEATLSRMDGRWAVARRDYYTGAFLMATSGDRRAARRTVEAWANGEGRAELDRRFRANRIAYNKRRIEELQRNLRDREAKLARLIEEEEGADV